MKIGMMIMRETVRIFGMCFFMSVEVKLLRFLMQVVIDFFCEFLVGYLG